MKTLKKLAIASVFFFGFLMFIGTAENISLITLLGLGLMVAGAKLMNRYKDLLR